MHSFKGIFRAFIVSMLIIFCAAVSHGEAEVQFSWAILTDTATGLKALDFSSTPKLKTGTTLQIYLEQKPGAFIYLYLEDAAGGVTFIYPGDAKHYDAEQPADQVIRIPPDSARFELQPPAGQEKLHLLASPVRLTKLEELTAAFMEKEEDVNRRAEVLRELKLLRKQGSSLSQNTEISVPVAGTIRSRGADGSFEAVQVNVKGFYSKILRIDHE